VILQPDLPPEALLRKDRDAGAYTDCYATEIAARVSHATYVEAFYTTWIFKLERLLLKWLVAKPSTDAEARRLSLGELDAFSAWTVDARARDQLLLVDFQGKTKSWLMVTPLDAGTRLYFGSAVVRVREEAGQRRLGFTFRALLGFHKLYSRVLLSAARSRLASYKPTRATPAK
jgi:hypothetical protein